MLTSLRELARRVIPQKGDRALGANTVRAPITWGVRCSPHPA